jgi:uncharacterized membrane protein
MNRWALTEEELRRTRAQVKSWAAKASSALMVGAVTAAPLVLTLWVLWLVLSVAAVLGGLITGPIAAVLGLAGPEVHPVRWGIVNALVAAGALIVIGTLAKGVLGRVVGDAIEGLITRIPLGNMVYGSARKLIASFHGAPENAKNVVLIEFPSPEMRCVGLVTQRFTAQDTGEELAAVYVPTTPNPTSGYVEIVPVDRLVWLDWTINEAMQFIVSGGAISPDAVVYRRTGLPDALPPTPTPGPDADAPPFADR